jgi:hypothetical protein
MADERRGAPTEASLELQFQHAVHPALVAGSADWEIAGHF